MIFSQSSPVLRRRRRDLWVTGAIALVSVGAIGGAVLTADIRQASLSTNDVPRAEAPAEWSAPPEKLTEAFRVDSPNPAAGPRGIVSQDVLIAAAESGVTAYTDKGEVAWEYSRGDAPLCSVATAWDKVVMTFRTGVGCGDTVAIDAATGQYAGTRSAINSPEVVPISSNDRVGTVSSDRVDIWRSDMVRTVEYGNVEAKQEPGLQPQEGCSINSALTRTELLVVSETCPQEPDVNWLRFQKTTPEDSRAPELNKSVAINAEGVRLVAVGQSGATVYVPGPEPQLISYDDNGVKLAQSTVEPSPAINESSTPFASETADLPHHISWFDGQTLYLLTPSSLDVDRSFDDALGTGIAVGGRLLYPTDKGIAVANWSTGKVERTIPVDRGSYDGPVALSLAGEAIIETRGKELVTFHAG